MIRPATPEDVPSIAALILELAEFEDLVDQVDTDVERLREDLFGANPKCEALVAADPGAASGEIHGYALVFESYSTFKFRSCLWLEDLYVTPKRRGTGAGKALFEGVAALAAERGCPRLDWCVLDWNRDAIGFYERQGAELLVDWRVCRLEGAALARFAENGC